MKREEGEEGTECAAPWAPEPAGTEGELAHRYAGQRGIALFQGEPRRRHRLSALGRCFCCARKKARDGLVTTGQWNHCREGLSPATHPRAIVRDGESAGRPGLPRPLPPRPLRLPLPEPSEIVMFAGFYDSYLAARCTSKGGFRLSAALETRPRRKKTRSRHRGPQGACFAPGLPAAGWLLLEEARPRSAAPPIGRLPAFADGDVGSARGEGAVVL